MRGEQIAACERARHALDLRRKGASYRDIAHSLGVAPSTAYGYVREELDELRREVTETAAELRDVEVQRLDALTSQLFLMLDRSNPSEGARLALALVRVSESRRQLLGLDAPQKIEHSGNLYTIREVSPDCPEWGEPTAKGVSHAAA